MAKTSRKGSRATSPGPRDLSNGVIVVLSGGPFDFMNPRKVRDRMDQVITDVNNDPYVLANTGGQGLTFKFFPGQLNHIHQSQWPELCKLEELRKASPLILIGHSNGGAAVIDLARCLGPDTVVDFAFTADSVFTLIDNGDPNKVPANVALNLNPFVIPTIYWGELPFFFGQRNERESNGSLDGIMNIGLPFEEPGAIAHRDAFYDLAGGDQSLIGTYRYPELIRDSTLAVLKGADQKAIFQLALGYLQVLANEVRIPIDIETADGKTTLKPAGFAAQLPTSRLGKSIIEDLRSPVRDLERVRLRLSAQ